MLMTINFIWDQPSQYYAFIYYAVDLRFHNQVLFFLKKEVWFAEGFC
jgi:hypothetical protein